MISHPFSPGSLITWSDAHVKTWGLDKKTRAQVFVVISVSYDPDRRKTLHGHQMTIMDQSGKLLENRIPKAFQEVT